MIDGHVYVGAVSKGVWPVGKSDQLCANDSSFMQSYKACMECIADNGGDDVIQKYAEPKFSQSVNYCEGEDAKTGTTEITTEIIDPTATADCDGCITTNLNSYRSSTSIVVLRTKTVPTSSLLQSKPKSLVCVTWARFNSGTRVGLYGFNSQGDGYAPRNWISIGDCHFRDRSRRYVYPITPS